MLDVINELRAAGAEAMEIRSGRGDQQTAVRVGVDTWVTGWRPRDLNTASFPQLRGYCLANYFTDETFRKRLAVPPEENVAAATMEWAKEFGHSLQWDDLKWIREATKLPIMLKGICRVDDAKRAVDDYLVRAQVLANRMNDERMQADVAITGDKIVYVGRAPVKARRVIDAAGQVVTPGFIDMMGATSLPLLLEPASAESKLRQGITTILAGEGGSQAPQTEKTFPAEVRKKGYYWTTFGEYFKLLEKQGIGVNTVHNVGAAQIRQIVIGDKDREPTPAELDQMRKLVDVEALSCKRSGDPLPSVGEPVDQDV